MVQANVTRVGFLKESLLLLLLLVAEALLLLLRLLVEVAQHMIIYVDVDMCNNSNSSLL